ncbi:hypothetical protein ASPWEDRAFT_484638 [Aspergillus wentii DTO 134E9]|uniref:Uncharacterized protein n=1 Tax=Aspergillus wentii DTO 134E9 TaxID=1073089 RepID=A0A1L9RJ74_ASPWE|nr:uncharacterized protein ASPWEDRAFT_484638 [Aspergillus wentii DTO 134E9]OJJ34943.1 hypothetical protein ASPWEDRAFT_484638 [Aspergillus wentii DTO 134E9]
MASVTAPIGPYGTAAYFHRIWAKMQADPAASAVYCIVTIPAPRKIRCCCRGLSSVGAFCSPLSHHLTPLLGPGCSEVMIHESLQGFFCLIVFSLPYMSPDLDTLRILFGIVVIWWWCGVVLNGDSTALPQPFCTTQEDVQSKECTWIQSRAIVPSTSPNSTVQMFSLEHYYGELYTAPKECKLGTE